MKDYLKKKEVQCDLSVYKKEQLFRLPFMEKGTAKDGRQPAKGLIMPKASAIGTYSLFYKFVNEKLVPCEFDEKKFIVRQ